MHTDHLARSYEPGAELRIDAMRGDRLFLAQEQIRAAVEIELAFDFAMTAYRDVEVELLSLGVDGVLFAGHGWDRGYQVTSLVNRRLIYAFTCYRAYREQMGQRLHALYGPAAKAAWDTAFAQAVKNDTGFAAIEALRDMSQHHMLPISGVSFLPQGAAGGGERLVVNAMVDWHDVQRRASRAAAKTACARVLRSDPPSTFQSLFRSHVATLRKLHLQATRAGLSSPPRFSLWKDLMYATHTWRWLFNDLSNQAGNPVLHADVSVNAQVRCEMDLTTINLLQVLQHKNYPARPQLDTYEVSTRLSPPRNADAPGAGAVAT